MTKLESHEVALALQKDLHICRPEGVLFFICIFADQTESYFLYVAKVCRLTIINVCSVTTNVAVFINIVLIRYTYIVATR